MTNRAIVILKIFTIAFTAKRNQCNLPWEIIRKIPYYFQLRFSIISWSQKGCFRIKLEEEKTRDLMWLDSIKDTQQFDMRQTSNESVIERFLYKA